MALKKEKELLLQKPKLITKEVISREELSIEDIHRDLEAKLDEQGVVIDKKNFVFKDSDLTFGEKLADMVAGFGGSWLFVTAFVSVIFFWVFSNIVVFAGRGFDPFPFVLLNLVLSCLAAIQAPIILMSQKRQAQRDRKQQEINLEKDIVDFKQDRLDLILDQKQWDLLLKMDERIKRIEGNLSGKRKSRAKVKKKS